ncbi:putative holin-like toxin [Enterococcus sp. AZ192]
MSALEAFQLILSFGMFTIALIKLIVELLKDKKPSALAKQRLFLK